MKKSTSTILILVMGLFQFICVQDSEEELLNEAFPFSEDNWEVIDTDSSNVEIMTLKYKGKESLFLESSQIAYLKNRKFENFVLDFYCNGLSGPGFGFRVKDSKNFEYVYFRLASSNKKDALQYLPIHNGNLPWQLYNYPKYEGNATFPRREVMTFPKSIMEQLKEGKINQILIKLFKAKDISFGKESEIYIGDETSGYIYDPKESNALLFEEKEDSIVFLDARTWIHVKVQVVDNKASFFIEDMDSPALLVEDLKSDIAEGGISLISDGAGVYYSDVSITELKAKKNNDQNATKPVLSGTILTKWKVSEMFRKDSANFELQIDSILQHQERFKPIEADSDGLLNISRYYSDMSKTVALTCNIISDSDKKVKLNFDYADHLVALLNSKVLYDKGMNFQPAPEKGQEGRVFVNDENVELDLKKGPNRLVFILSGDYRQKFNWGFIAKLENLDGLEIE